MERAEVTQNFMSCYHAVSFSLITRRAAGRPDGDLDLHKPFVGNVISSSSVNYSAHEDELT